MLYQYSFNYINIMYMPRQTKKKGGKTNEIDDVKLLLVEMEKRENDRMEQFKSRNGIFSWTFLNQ